MIWLSDHSILSVTNECYSRNAQCALYWISTFLFIDIVQQMYMTFSVDFDVNPQKTQNDNTQNVQTKQPNQGNIIYTRKRQTKLGIDDISRRFWLSRFARPFVFLGLKDFLLTQRLNTLALALRVPEEDFSKNALCELNLISTFYFQYVLNFSFCTFLKWQELSSYLHNVPY